MVAERLAVNLSHWLVRQQKTPSCLIISPSMNKVDIGGALPTAWRASSQRADPAWTHVVPPPPFRHCHVDMGIPPGNFPYRFVQWVTSSPLPHLRHPITLGPLSINSAHKQGNRVEKLNRDSSQFQRPQTTRRLAKGICCTGFLGVFLG